MNEFIPSGGEQAIFTDRTLHDYEVLIHTKNPYSTNQERTDLQMAQLEELGHHFDVRQVETTPDKIETAQTIVEVMGDDAEVSTIWSDTGDGGNGGAVRAAVASGAALWQANAGFANNLSRASFGFLDRGRLRSIIDKGRIAKTKPLEWLITGPDGEVLFQEMVPDEVGIGDMAHAQTLRELPVNREYFKEVGLAERALHSAILGAKAIGEAEPFTIVRTHSGDGTEIDPLARVVEEYNELAFCNVGHIAWLGRVRNASMTDHSMVEFTNSYRTKIGSWLHYLKLYSIGITGTDIPDGQTVQFDVLSDTKAQASGDPFPLPKGSHVSIRRSDKELLVVTTRKRP